jgi:hypothetical protein
MLRFATIILFLSLLASCHAQELNYTGSTPANDVIRRFLDIGQDDSIDFIRWKISFKGDEYKLHCNYGVGKPNTKGFIKGGSALTIEGHYNVRGDHYLLMAGQRKIDLVAINKNLLHFAYTDRSLMKGTGGWSYTLNNEKPETGNNQFKSNDHLVFKDSIGFHGRTPCAGIDSRPECNKLKWRLVLFSSPGNIPDRSYAIGSTMTGHQRVTGSWTIIKAPGGRLINKLEKGRLGTDLYFVLLGENILCFCDANGNLLVGDEDFSYTLSRFF